ncbi:lipopolysaccharide biosynthesis protein [Mesoflavibacter zeaxanthinifaciens]|uniref:lipopolysaccharide biosynthesis protein n=1 Tax=Mesoflavibacter zeaxanthinifaciens TaxID=393060 RepID=UPI0026E95C93|nr:oligosaccharide flippase family protein [Mesoflavibacter zeaxanthinifaciens]
MIKKKISSLLQSEYVSNISIQVLGTGIAQLIPLLIMPILSRVYNEDTFASYATFIAVSGVLSVVTGARYHLAIVLPNSQKEAYNIFLVSVYFSFIYAILIFVGISVFNFYFENLSNVRWSSFLIPLYVLFYGIWLSIINLSIRDKKFKINSFSKIIQASGNGFFSLSFGLLNVSSGLIFGKILGVFSSILFLKYKLNIKSKLKISYQDFMIIVKKYKDFPKYGILPSFLDAASLQAPVFIIGSFYTVKQLGFYGFTVMALAGPMSIIAVSFKDVFYQKIAETYNQEKFNVIRKIYKTSALTLLFIGIPILLIVIFFGEQLFSLIFGENWTTSGIYAKILVGSFVIKLIVSPLSTIFNVVKKLNILSMWQIIYFFTTFITLILAVVKFEVTLINLLYIYLIHELILYTFYFYLQYRTIKKL